MKTLKTLLPAFALLVAFSTSALAQDVNVSATVVNALTATATDVDFGTVDNNIDAYLNSGGGEGPTTTTNVSGSTPGAIDITNAADNAALTVSWDASVTLADGANTLTFTPALVFNSTVLDTNTGTNINLGAGNTSGTINIGGSLDTAGAPAGSYATVTPLSVTVDYQ